MVLVLLERGAQQRTLWRAGLYSVFLFVPTLVQIFRHLRLIVALRALISVSP